MTRRLALAIFSLLLVAVPASAHRVLPCVPAIDGRCETWSVDQNGSSDLYDRASALTLSADGRRIFMAVESLVDFSPRQSAAIGAYDAASGAALWLAPVGRDGDAIDGIAGLALSPDQTVLYSASFICTDNVDLTTCDIQTDAFDARTGASLWRSRYETGDHDTPRAIVADDDGVYLAGRTATWTGYDYAVLAYDLDGTLRWLSTFDGPAHADDAAIALAVGGDRVVVTGQSTGASLDITTIALDTQTGARAWTTTFDGAGHASDTPAAIAIHDGRAYVAGTTRRDATTPDVTTMAYDIADGSLVWSDSLRDRTLGGEGYAIVAGDAGIFTLGYARTAEGKPMTLVAHEADGTRRWVRFNAHTQVSIGLSLALDDAGRRIYAAGGATGNLQDYDTITLAYDTTSGNERWFARAPGAGPRNGGTPVFVSVSADGSDVYTASQTWVPGVNNATDATLTRYPA